MFNQSKSSEPKQTVAGDGHTAATPAVQKGIKNTGRQPGEGVGDSPQGKSETHTRPFNSDQKPQPKPKEEAVPTNPAPMDTNIQKDGFDTGVAK